MGVKDCSSTKLGGDVPPPTIWREIADDLRKRVEDGEWEPGQRIPAVRELMAHYETPSQNAVVRAISTLTSEGLLWSDPNAPRRGVRVAERTQLIRRGARRYQRNPEGLAPNMDEAAAGGWQDKVEAERWREPASEDIAARLNIQPGQPVTVGQYVWLTEDGQPYQVGTQYEPLAITQGTPIEEPVDGTRGNPGVIARFDSIGLHVDRVEELVRAKVPSAKEARILQMGSKVPILHITRTHWAGDIAVETADIAIRSDRMVIVTTHEVPLSEGASE
ncbi:GntR family transcriptional regulator [Nocardia sp. NPDC050406]|uniref:GntR family transcriptional regulator n=1 Tax=Nocardia sp. NPDC050406 TaxID=3364318 RepID=UPI0037B0C44C